MKINFMWEELYSRGTTDNIFDGTFRSKVYGGWVVRHECLFGIDNPLNKDDETWKNGSGSMVFVPDPNHEWEIE